MLSLLNLLLPALIPSWRFFKTVEPSPRVQWRWAARGADWQEFYPRPARVAPLRMLRRMVWNPGWNEALFMVSLAERQTIAPSTRSETEIHRRIAARLQRGGAAADAVFAVRILYVYRDTEGLHETTTYEGPAVAVGACLP